MKGECEPLPSFLSSKLKADVTSSENKIFGDSNSSSSSKLKRLVNNLVYRRYLNYRHWVVLEGDVVKVSNIKRSEKKKKEEIGISNSTIKYGG